MSIFDQDPRRHGGADRGISLLASVVLHACVILTLWSMPVLELFIRPIPPPEPIIRARPIYFRFAKKLPEIDPTTRIGQEATPAAEKQSPNVLIAQLQPDSRKQLIYQPTPEKIQKEIPSPNTVQATPPPAAPKPLEAPKIEAPAAPPKPEPRKFQAPEAARPAPRKTLDAEPTLSVDTRPAVPLPGVGATSLNAPKYYKKFEAPKAQAASSQPRMINEEVKANVDARPALPSSTVGAGSNVNAPNYYKKFEAPQARNSGTGKSRMINEEAAAQLPPGAVNLAILGTKPMPNLDHLPPGQLKGAFSEAPRVGAVSSGAPGANNSKAPAIAVRDNTGNMGGELKRELFYSQISEAQAVRTLSAPLRPSSRMLPPLIEQRFAGRAVYTLVIPQPKLPVYNADWILWFAEIQPSGGAPALKAPLPQRKLEPIRPPAQKTVELRVQLHVVVTAEGGIEIKSIVRNREPSLAAWIKEDLALWLFRAAERDGVAVAVEGILEIPYVVPVAN